MLGIFSHFPGTFHEWTIENQSPGGSAKLSKAALEKMFLGVRVQTGDNGNATTQSAILRTHSMREFENETVKSLEYFGAHPVSKFAIGNFFTSYSWYSIPSCHAALFQCLSNIHKVHIPFYEHGNVLWTLKQRYVPACSLLHYSLGEYTILN